MRLSLITIRRAITAMASPLTGRKESVTEADISITGKAVSEENIHYEQLPEHLISWVTTK